MRTDTRPALWKGMDDRVLACARVEGWTEVRGGDEAGASSEAKGRSPDTTRVEGRSPQSDEGNTMY